jgi:chemotaxis protein histidine kinase CheA
LVVTPSPGLWPADESTEALEDALVEVARHTADPEQASRLRRIAEALGGLTREVGVEVAAAFATRMAGLG